MSFCHLQDCIKSVCLSVVQNNNGINNDTGKADQNKSTRVRENICSFCRGLSVSPPFLSRKQLENDLDLITFLVWLFKNSGGNEGPRLEE